MTQKFGVGNRRAAKLGAVQVEQIRLWYGQGMTQRELGERFKLSVVQVGRIVRMESWKDTGAARGYVAQGEWDGLGEGGGVAGEGESLGAQETNRRLAEASLREVRRRMELGENPFEGGGIGGLAKGGVPDEVKERALQLLGQGGGEEVEEPGPVGIDDLPV